MLAGAVGLAGLLVKKAPQAKGAAESSGHGQGEAGFHRILLLPVS